MISQAPTKGMRRMKKGKGAGDVTFSREGIFRGHFVHFFLKKYTYHNFLFTSLDSISSCHIPCM